MTDTEAPEQVRSRAPLIAAGLGLVVLIGFGIARPDLGARLRAVLQPNHPIAYHNAVLAQSRWAETITVEAGIGRVVDDPIRPTVVHVRDPDEIAQVLSLLHVDDHGQDLDVFHKCCGHVRFTIQAGDQVHTVQFDHGSGIYPVSRAGGKKTGFVSLDRVRATALIAFLRSKGISDSELGIAPPR